MKIAFIHYDLPPAGEGGVAYQVDLLARELARRHELTVFTTTDDGAARPYATATRNPVARGRIARLLGGLAFAGVDFSSFDVVHAHGDSWALRHHPVVRTFYGSAKAEAGSATRLRRKAAETVLYGFERLAALRADVTITISEDTRRYLPRASSVIPCGVDHRIFVPSDARFDEPTVLFVAGRLGGRKRGSLALEAFRRVRLQVPHAQLVLVTRDHIDEANVRCYSAISRESLAELYRRSWVLCSTSSYEGFGLPYAEALLSGLPIVTTCNPGALEVLGGTASIVADEDSLVQSLLHYLAGSPPEPIVPTIAHRYRIDRVAAQYEAVYQQAMTL